MIVYSNYLEYRDSTVFAEQVFPFVKVQKTYEDSLDSCKNEYMAGKLYFVIVFF